MISATAQESVTLYLLLAQVQVRMAFMELLLHQEIFRMTSADDLPSVQVGDPFQEKLLLEASLEIAETDASCWYARYGCCWNYLFYV